MVPLLRKYKKTQLPICMKPSMEVDQQHRYGDEPIKNSIVLRLGMCELEASSNKPPMYDWNMLWQRPDKATLFEYMCIPRCK